MTRLEHSFFVLSWAALLAGELVTGQALGQRFRPNIRRDESPVTYWVMMALQGAFFIALLKWGRSWTN